MMMEVVTSRVWATARLDVEVTYAYLVEWHGRRVQGPGIGLTAALTAAEGAEGAEGPPNMRVVS